MESIRALEECFEDGTGFGYGALSKYGAGAGYRNATGTGYGAGVGSGFKDGTGDGSEITLLISTKDEHKIEVRYGDTSKQ